METLKIKLTGTSPLIVHGDRLANPLDPLKKEIATYTAKRKKTDEAWAVIFRLEWEGALYFKESVGPVMPGMCLKAMLRSAAKLSKMGRHIQRGVMILETEVPIEYDGPRELERMWKAERFADIRSVVVKGSRVMRCRPIFHEWTVSFSVLVNADILNPDEVVQFFRTAGQIEGLCENRTNGYGRFEVESL